MHQRPRTWSHGLGLAVILWGTASLAAEPALVEFNRDVRPILSENCYPCHGPDRARRKADLRLDTEEGAAVVLARGTPDKSEFLRRLAATDAERMPPKSSGHTLTATQVETLRRWFAQGATWQKHWSFLPPARTPLPLVKNADWPRNGIDHFVLARLEHEGLSPSPEADRETLLRRVTLDLTGLPPTLAEVDAFLADTSPDAYEKVVDRLLGSPRHGEKMAARWLDAARYADTSGYQTDGERFMWRWRDWVIEAFNANMPFDRFTIEQLAGDLLPNATMEQRIATGFNRNHRGNAEGGIIPEEYAVEYVVDRVETTATVWLGLTLGCARCHEHKFDPITQQEFYRVFALFNNVPENGRAIKYGNSPPYIPAPTRAQQAQLTALQAELATAEKHWHEMRDQLTAAQEKWEKTVQAKVNWVPDRNLVAQFRLDGKPTLDAANVGAFGFFDKFTLTARVKPEGPRNGTIVSRMTDVPHGDGYGIEMHAGKIFVHLTKRWLDDALRVETECALPADEWHHVAVTYDGSRMASGVKVYFDGQLAPTKVLLDELNQTFATKEPLRIGHGGGPESRFHGSIEDVRIHDDALTPGEVASLSVVESVGDIAARPRDQRTPQQTGKLNAYFLEKEAPDSLRSAYRQLQTLRKQRELLIESFPTVMVMEELSTPRDTFLLRRGQYDKPGEKVTPGVPAALARRPSGGNITNRLALANWLVESTNPLTARVTINRFWQSYFGTGLVKTGDDFGAQGEWPSHPELLDWLACEFMGRGWDMKAIQRLIVTSATYRQSSKLSTALAQRDPDNRLLARGPRYRWPAEVIRDQALAASGLLVERLGGPSVKPYQPAGLWKELTGIDEYVQDHGENLYRRGLYTFWKRTMAPPALATFDAAGRETCVVRETRTNTPLQALNLMNDVTFVETARALAQRVLRDNSTADERVTLAFRLATGRKPKAAELGILLEGLQQQQVEYRKDRKAALKLVSLGESPRDPRIDVSELAAYTALAGVILNLDEVVTKE